MGDGIWNWREVDIFAGFSMKEIDDALSKMPMISFREGEYLFQTDTIGDYLFLLRRGTVKVSYVNLRGDERILNIFSPGDVFGELFLGKYRQRIAHAQALEEVVTCRLGEADFLNLIQHLPSLALNFIRHTVDEQRDASIRLRTLLQPDPRSRLLGTLLSLVNRQPKTSEPWVSLPLSLTQEDIANMAGVNRSTASSLLNRLRREGILGGTGRIITVNKVAFDQALDNVGLENLE